jgi:hypothetical protein
MKACDAVVLEAIVALRQPGNVSITFQPFFRSFAGPRSADTPARAGVPGATTIGRGLYDVLVTAKAFEYRDKKRGMLSCCPSRVPHVVFRDGERLERDDADESPNLKKGRAKKIDEKSEKDAA